MKINSNILEEIYSSAGDKRLQKGRAYEVAGRVNIKNIYYDDEYNFHIEGQVKGEYGNYNTNILVEDGEIQDVSCQCDDYYSHYGVCKHIVATIMAAVLSNNENVSNNKRIGRKDNSYKYTSFRQLVDSLYNEQVKEINKELENERILQDKKVIIEPKVTFDKYYNLLKVEFKVGYDRLYKIKEISEFYKHFKNEEIYRYGNKLEFLHIKENVKDESKSLLEFILQNGESIYYVNLEASQSYRYYGKVLNDSSISLNQNKLDDFFEIMKGKVINFQDDFKEGKLEFLDENPKIDFKLEQVKKDEYKLKANYDFRNLYIFSGSRFKYILKENKIYRCDKKFESTILKVIENFRENFLTEVLLSNEQLSELFSIIMPIIKDRIEYKNINEKIIEKYKPQNLAVKVFLDFDENDYIVADVKFCYGDEEFNPLDESVEIEVSRDIIKETKITQIFNKTGFLFYEEKNKLVLVDEEKIYDFLSCGIEEYMQKFEVLVTDNFKSKQIKRPQVGAIGAKVENNLLKVDLSNLNIDPKELEEIMQKYKLKKKYHKLKSGVFLSLEENEDIEFIDKLTSGMDINYKDIQKGEIRLPINRSIYLSRLLENINTEVKKNKEYSDLIDGISKEKIANIEVPKELEKILRYYQKLGFKWLKTLDYYHFGGILADDMGLR